MNFKFIPWFVLAISIVVTISIWGIFLDDHKNLGEIQFQLFSENISLQIKEKLKTHEQVLMGFQGLMSTSEIVEHDEFHNFYDLQHIEQRFPDSQGVGFIEYVSDENRKNEINQEWAELGLEHRIYPEGERSEYFVVTFLEPDNFRNNRALGYDVYSEQIRQIAIDDSIRTGQTTTTGKIILVQETENEIQNGFLIILPVYYFHDDTSEKYGELMGFVYSVFRMDDFVLGTLDHEIFHYTEIKIYDGTVTAENLFFDSSTILKSHANSEFLYFIDVDFGGKTWLIQFTGIPTSQFTSNTLTMIPIIGFSLSGILFFTFLLFLKNTQLSKSIAEKEKISLLGELTSRLAHDIRNPLSTINMAKDLLEKKTTDEKNKELLHIIDNGISRISHQVNNVLDFVRAKPSTFELVSVKSILNSVIEHTTIPSDIKISKHFSNSAILCDFIQLETVFTNILINAIQSLNGTGDITIKVLEKNNFVEIAIIDSGPGIPHDNLEKIFEPMFTTKQEGTGLGLVSCKTIIESHMGTISVKNNPTTFTVRLPLPQ